MDEEIDVLQSIFCRPGEFQALCMGKESSIFRVTPFFALDEEDIVNWRKEKQHVTITLTVGDGYPLTLPDIQLTEKKAGRNTAEDQAAMKALCRTVLCRSESMVGTPMLYDIINLLMDEWRGYSRLRSSLMNREEERKKVESHPKENLLTVVSYDHMNAKAKYCQSIGDQVESCGLIGKLYFCNMQIFLVLVGVKDSIKEFIVWNKTKKVDVDSLGKPCKERLLRVVAEMDVGTFTPPVTGFTVKEMQKAEMEQTLKEDFPEGKIACSIFSLISS